MDESLLIDFGSIAPKAVKPWIETCKALGRAMSIGEGPWGMGVFKSFACVKGKRRVYGKIPRAGRAWRLTFTRTGKTVSLTLEDGLSGTHAARLALAASPELASVLSDPELAHLTAFALLDSLPMAARVEAKMTKRRRNGESVLLMTYLYAELLNDTKLRFRVPEPPERLILYTLAWSRREKIWRGKVAGEARRLKVARQKVTYLLDADATAALANGPLWAQNADGRGTRAEELAEAANDAELALITYERGSAADRLAQSLLDTAASGYVGMRYGLQLARGDPLLRRTSFFGLLVEIRGGPVGGLRYYYDRLPEVTAEEPSADDSSVRTSVAWSRHLFGYSFGFDPGFLVDEINIAPKIGVWAFDATLPIARDDDGRVIATQRFRLGRALSAGLEVGVEWMSGSYTIRPWAGIDGGFSLLKDGGTATSRRVGLDAYFSVGPVLSLFGAPIKIALLGFVLGESVVLTDPKAEGI